MKYHEERFSSNPWKIFIPILKELNNISNLTLLLFVGAPWALLDKSVAADLRTGESAALSCGPQDSESLTY